MALRGVRPSRSTARAAAAAVPTNWGRVLGGLAVAGIGAYFVMDKRGVDRFGEDVHHSQHTIDTEYEVMKHNFGAYSGNPAMDHYAHQWNRFKAYGPFGFNMWWSNFTTQVNNAVNTYLFSPGALFAVAGLYLAGLQPHKLVTVPAKALWQTRVLQDGAKGLVKAISNMKMGWGTKALRTLFLTPGGLLLTGCLAFFGYKFSNVLSGDAQKQFFGGQSH